MGGQRLVRPHHLSDLQHCVSVYIGTVLVRQCTAGSVAVSQAPGTSKYVDNGFGGKSRAQFAVFTSIVCQVLHDGDYLIRVGLPILLLPVGQTRSTSAWIRKPSVLFF